jgi:hypothetical protein
MVSGKRLAAENGGSKQCGWEVVSRGLQYPPQQPQKINNWKQQKQMLLRTSQTLLRKPLGIA